MKDAPSGQRPALLIGVALALTAAAMALGVWHPFPLGADDWAWPVFPQPVFQGCAAPVAAYALMLAAVMLVWRRLASLKRRGEVLLVLFLVALAFAAQVGVAQQSPAGYQEGVIAISQPGPNRYHKAARSVDRLAPLLGSYERWMRGKSHTLIITHPGGPMSLFWCLNHVFAGDEEGAAQFVRWCEDTVGSGVRLASVPWAARLMGPLSASELAGAWLSTFLLQLVACLAVVPAYLLARRLHGRHAAAMAAAFTAALPSLLLFSPGLDQCYPALAATACWLAYAAGEERSAGRAALSGLAVSAGLFFSLVFAVVGLWCVLLALSGFRTATSPHRGRDAARLLASGAAGALVPLVVLYAAFGYNSPTVWWACWEANATFNAQVGRVYWKWVLINPVEFLAFVGVPVACLLVSRVVSEVWALAHRRVAGRDWPTLILAALLVLLNLSGGNLGEVARLWMFLMPACAVVAAGELQRYAPYRRALFAVLFVLQCGQVIVFKGTLDLLLGLYRGLGG